MEQSKGDKPRSDLPQCAAQFIQGVVKRIRYRRHVRDDVRAELISHFEDDLKQCASADERQKKAENLVAQFGDAKLLAVLCRRAKKRCRSLWATTLIRTVQTAGVLLLSFAFYTIWFVSGKPSITVDYVAMLNQIGRPKVAEEDNAWPHYERAIALYVAPSLELKEVPGFRKDTAFQLGGFSKLTADEQKAVSKWVSDNELAWREFAAASSKRYCSRPYRVDSNSPGPKMLFGVLLPPLSEIRGLAKVGVLMSRIGSEQGRVEDCLQDSVCVARAAAHWHGKATLIEQLTALGISHLAHDEVLRIVAEGKLSAEQLQRLQSELAGIYSDGFPQMDFEGERICLLDFIQHAFTQGGPGGGHLIPSRWVSMLGDDGLNSDYPEWRVITLPISTAMSMVHAGRHETIAKTNEIFDQAAEWAKLTPYQCHQREGADPEKTLMGLPQLRYATLHDFAPSISRVSEILFRQKALDQAVLAILAVKRWRLDKGTYPASLQRLVQGGYLSEVPPDPFSDGPLVYRHQGDGFMVYSVGLNFTDDGGKPGLDRKGQPRSWQENGDMVFWPIPSPPNEGQDTVR